ncbi:MAG: hypothetical protein IPJ85_16190 [Flavobacteriales bacterium]|nr:hypothetical protein [Flavobacteriales bacterium]
MMIALLLLFLFACAVKAAWLVRSRTDAPLLLCQCAGIASAVAALGFGYALLLFADVTDPVLAIALACAVLLAVVWAWPHAAEWLRSSRLPRLDAWSAVMAIGALWFTYRFVGFSYRWGGFDGWAQWNMHARFLIGETDWKALLETRFAHPDYPLMLPAIIAVGWRALGAVEASIPMLISAGVAALLIASVHGAVRAWAMRPVAAAAVLFLCLDPDFARCAASQYADTLLALWMLLAAVFLSRADSASRQELLLAGFFAGCAAWTKNEGVAFFAAMLLVTTWISRDRIKAVLRFLLGAALPLVVLIWYKVVYAPPSDLAGPHGIAWTTAADPQRHWTILVSASGHLMQKAPFFLLLLIAGMVYWRRIRSRRIMALVLLMGAASYATYLITPYDLAWHVTHSADRLAHQLVPLLVMALATAFKSKPLVSAQPC